MSGAGLAVVVLAAGAGRRFGGAKQLALVENRPVLSRVLDSLAGVGEARIVVLGAAAERVRPLVKPPWRAVVAAGWEGGPGASLRAGLEAAGDADAALIVLGDLAWLDPEAVERVLAAAAADPAAEAFRACENGRPGHPLLVRGELLRRARDAPDEGLRPLLEAVRVERVECAGLGAGRDVDTPADLR